MTEHEQERRQFRIVYMPSPEEIDQWCATIQAGWTDREEQTRRGLPPDPVTAVVVSLPAGMHCTDSDYQILSGGPFH